MGGSSNDDSMQHISCISKKQKNKTKKEQRIKSWMGGRTGCIGSTYYKPLIPEYPRCDMVWPSPACWAVCCLRRHSKLRPPIPGHERSLHLMCDARVRCAIMSHTRADAHSSQHHNLVSIPRFTLNETREWEGLGLAEE